ncbi:hypothetical protein [Halobacillus sp. A1]|uniref:hypothetical protein n=1 Tax=Halobacillus sp. A1 TaxID=2880262 RepID=UPI0035322D0B
MNKQALNKLGFDQVVEEISSYAFTKKGKETIRALEPMNVRRRIERSFQEIKEAIGVLRINSSIPIYSLESIIRSLEEGEKGRYIRVEALSRMIDFLDHCRKLKRFMDDKGYVAPTISVYVDSMEDITDLEEELVKREHRQKVKGAVIDQSSSGATLFIEPKELEERQYVIEQLKLTEQHEVEQIMYYLTGLVS